MSRFIRLHLNVLAVAPIVTLLTSTREAQHRLELATSCYAMQASNVQSHTLTKHGFAAFAFGRNLLNLKLKSHLRILGACRVRKCRLRTWKVGCSQVCDVQLYWHPAR